MLALSAIQAKSASQMLKELAASFTTPEEYIAYLEDLSLAAFTDALATVQEDTIQMSAWNRAEFSFKRAVAFLLAQEKEISRRINVAVCGSTLDEPEDEEEDGTV